MKGADFGLPLFCVHIIVLINAMLYIKQEHMFDKGGDKMNVVGAMLTMLMDDMKCVRNAAEYAIESARCMQEAEAEWFSVHARNKYDNIVEVYENVVRYAELHEKAASGDPVSAALHEYLEDQMQELKHLIDDL